MNHQKIKKCQEILKMEMEDLLADIISMEESYKKRLETKDITNYILKGNTSLLETEKSGVKAIINELKTLDTSEYTDLDKLAENIKIIFKDIISRKHFPKSVQSLSERKLTKVIKYMNET